ncbi:MAG: DUF2254 family protein, partial [Candidatus Limnocylindria bacterium]
QVTSIVASVAQETLGAVNNVAGWSRLEAGRGWQPALISSSATDVPAPPSGAVPSAVGPPSAAPVPAEESGYLQLVDLRALVAGAREAGGRYRLLVSPGAWVQAHAPLGNFEPLAGRDTDLEARARLLQHTLAVGQERSMEHDVAFGIQQLVDIAVKALSPSINDPTTAMNCIDRLVEVLTAAGLQADPPRAFADEDGVIRLEVPFPGFDELVPLAFDQVRHYGGDAPAIVIHLARALSLLVSTLSASRQRALRAEAQLLAVAAAAMTLEPDRHRALAAVEPLINGR